MATLYKRGDRYYLNWRDGGVQIRRSIGAIDRKAAEALRAEKEAELAGLITPTRGVTVAQLLDAYEAWQAADKPGSVRKITNALAPFRAAYGSFAAEGLSSDAREEAFAGALDFSDGLDGGDFAVELAGCCAEVLFREHDVSP